MFEGLKLKKPKTTAARLSEAEVKALVFQKPQSKRLPSQAQLYKELKEREDSDPGEEDLKQEGEPAPPVYDIKDKCKEACELLFGGKLEELEKELKEIRRHGH